LKMMSNSWELKRWRKKAEDRSVWAIILMEAPVNLLQPSGNFTYDQV
jgi:hypothetical protein